MKRPLKYNSDEVDKIASISTRTDKLGNVFFYVEYFHSYDVGMLGFKCDSLFTAVDIIKNNIYDSRTKK